MKRFRHVVVKALLSVALTVAFFVALELLCRMLHLGYPTRFLVPFEREGQPVWIDNQLFGYRFFAPPVSRAPTPLVIPVQKNPDEFRVVILGESAAMGEPEPAFGPARMLELFLTKRFPDRKITVLNAAMTAINSHVIREIVRDLEKIQPDVVILYIGNNEVVGPFGPGTVFNAHAISSKLNRLRTMVSRLQISSAMRRIWFERDGSDKQIWQGMEMFTNNLVPPDDPRLGDVYDSFARNIQAMIDQIHEFGAKPILCTMAVNLAAQAPFHGTSTGNSTSLDELKKSRDEDHLRFRADSGINSVIRETSRVNSNILLFCDAETIFEADGPPGNNFFLDHVHFNLSGSYLLAQSWDAAISGGFISTGEPAPRFQEISEFVMWNPYSALDVAENMKARSLRPPFSTASDHADRLINWTREIADLHRKIRLTPIDTMVQQFKDRIALDSHNHHLLNQVSGVLLYDNRYTEAGEYLNKLHKIVPHRADVRGWMSILAAISGKSDHIWNIMIDGAPPLGQIPADILISASDTLLQGGYRAESLALLEIAAKHFPYRTRLQSLLATRYAQIGNTYKAKQLFRELIQKHPDENWIKEEYGLLLAVSGDSTEAGKMLGHLQSSAIPRDKIKWVNFLIFQQNITDAERILKQMIADDPTHAEAYDLLALVYSQQNEINLTIPLLEKLSQLQPWRGDVWGQLGSIYDLINRASDAVAAYEKAIRLLSDPSGTMRSLAWLLATEDDISIRNPSRSISIMKQVFAIAGRDDPYSLYVYAAALAANERYEDAVLEINAGLSLLKSDTDAVLKDELIRARALFDQGAQIRINRASN